MIIPEEYYREEKIIKLSQSDIDIIVEELERTEYNIFTFMNYQKIIDKLKQKETK